MQEKGIQELKDLLKALIGTFKGVKNSLSDDGKINLSEGLKIGVSTVKDTINVNFKEIPDELRNLSKDEKLELYVFCLEEFGISNISNAEIEGFVSSILKFLK